MDVIFLGTLFVSFWTSTSVLAASYRPVNLQINMLNFNLSVTWEPPQVQLEENESFLYTVERSAVPGCTHKGFQLCTNISETFCSLLPAFLPNRNFCRREYIQVRSLSNINRSRGGRTTKSFTGANIEVSAPVVYNSTITDRNVSLFIRGPDTPFESNGEKLIMIEENVGKGLFKRDLEFNATLFESGNPSFVGRTWTSGNVRNGRKKLEYINLEPNTEYVIQMQSKYSTAFSNNVTTFQFRTVQSAPEYGPTITGFEVVKRYCDYRDVNVTWEESKIQRKTANITYYEVSFKSVRPTNISDIKVVVPATVQSTNVTGLSRWRRYHVIITSRNSGGTKEGQMSVLEIDEERLDTYKAKIEGEIKRISPIEGRITWKPPPLHEQCILGYSVKTYIDGSLEQRFTVDGYNTSSAIIEFKKSGKYYIDVHPIYNDTLDKGINVKTTYDYIIKAWKGYQWAILSITIFLVIFTIVSGMFGVIYCFCITKSLPDITKSKPMRVFSNENYVNTTLKEPPAKEKFDSTRVSVTEIKCKNEYTVDQNYNDEVFHSETTPEIPVLTVNVNHEKIHKDSSEDIAEMKDANDKQELTSVEYENEEIDISVTSQVSTTSANLEVSVTFPVDGYVARFPKKNPSLTVTIPKEVGYCPSSVFSPQSSSADSGICGSPSFRLSFTDYVPPSPFTEPDTEFRSLSRTSDSEECPYVKAELPETSGRVQSQSVSSETGSDCPNYNRLDFSKYVHDSPANGYLPMSPSDHVVKENVTGKIQERPCSYFFPPSDNLPPSRSSQT